MIDRGAVWILFFLIAVHAIPATLGGIAAFVAVSITVVIGAVGVVRDALFDRLLTVKAVVQAVLAGTSSVAHAVVEEIKAVDSLTDG